MTLLSGAFYLGANAKVQAIRFALCLAVGLAAGIIALLYLRKARPVERALTDFFATVCIGALFVVCAEFILDGKFELYGLAAFVLGTLPIPLIARRILNAKQRSDGKEPPSPEEAPSEEKQSAVDNGNSETAGSKHKYGGKKRRRR